MQSEGYNEDVHVTIYSMCGSSMSKPYIISSCISITSLLHSKHCISQLPLRVGFKQCMQLLHVSFSSMKFSSLTTATLSLSIVLKFSCTVPDSLYYRKT